MKALWIKIVLLAVALPGVWGNVAAQVTISADFDTGSIGSVRRIDSVRMLHAAKNSLEVMSFGIRSRIDPLNPVDTALLPSSRWFHFRLEGVKGKLMFLHIPNTEMVRPFYSYDGEEYLRFDAGECSLPQTVYKYFLHDTVYVPFFRMIIPLGLNSPYSFMSLISCLTVMPDIKPKPTSGHVRLSCDVSGSAGAEKDVRSKC